MIFIYQITQSLASNHIQYNTISLKNIGKKSQSGTCGLSAELHLNSFVITSWCTHPVNLLLEDHCSRKKHVGIWVWIVDLEDWFPDSSTGCGVYKGLPTKVLARQHRSPWNSWKGLCTKGGGVWVKTSFWNVLNVIAFFFKHAQIEIYNVNLSFTPFNHINLI